MDDEGLDQGDIVRLKAGGPKMTVLKLWLDAASRRTMVHCAWFNGSKLEHAESFDLEALQKV